MDSYYPLKVPNDCLSFHQHQLNLIQAIQVSLFQEAEKNSQAFNNSFRFNLLFFKSSFANFILLIYEQDLKQKDVLNFHLRKFLLVLQDASVLN